jgi:vacuolar-type H+-ATPase subunit I/STV1
LYNIDVIDKRFWRTKFMTTQISQKQAVVNGVKSVLGSSFDPSVPARDQLSDEQLASVKSYVTSQIVGGFVEFSKDNSDEKEVSKYVSGMVSNHLRKAKELNGGETYVPQSTGRGSRDAQISELNKLLKTYAEGTEEYNQILDAISSRKTEIAAEKAELSKEKRKAKELSSINMEALPDSLKSLANSIVGTEA